MNIKYPPCRKNNSYWFTGLSPRESRAPVNRSAESRWLAAELEKIKKEQPNLWTNAAVSFRI